MNVQQRRAKYYAGPTWAKRKESPEFKAACRDRMARWRASPAGRAWVAAYQVEWNALRRKLYAAAKAAQ